MNNQARRIRLEDGEGRFCAWASISPHIELPPAIKWGARVFASDKVEGVPHPVYTEIVYLPIKDEAVEIMENG